MRIKQLPVEVQSVLRSGITITDVGHCIIELVHNSLDAKATSIAVRLDLEKFSIQVVDNGRGLSKEELDLIGFRYMTNKCHSLRDLKTNVKYYGFRGESLASLRDCCGVLMIHSRARNSDETFTKVFRAGKEPHSAKKAVTERLCVGTTVVVRDFLCNLPVRRARIQPAIDMESVRLALVALSIVNYQVTFILRNDTTKSVVLQTKEYKDCSDALKHHCYMTEDISLIQVSVNKPPFKVFANISRETDQSDHFQFVYVNGRLVKNNSIYKFVRKNLAKSFYLRNIGKEIKANSCQPKEALHPIFVIKIQCPYTEYDVCSDPKKQKVEFRKTHVLLNCLEEMIQKFISTESNLHLEPEPKGDENTCLQEKPVNPVGELPARSNVMYGLNVKRQDNVDSIVPTNIISPVGSNNGSKNSNLENSDANLPTTEIVTSQQIPLEKNTRYQISNLSSTKSDIRSRSVSECAVTSDLENPLPFKAPKTLPLKKNRKRLSEHITTESETDVTPLKHKSTWNSTICWGERKPINSILPIVNYSFFEKALHNLSIARNVIFDCAVNGSFKTPKQAIQIDFYRSIKGNPNNNCLKVIEEKSINYIFKEKNSINCKKEIEPQILVKHNLQTNISGELVPSSKQTKTQFCGEKVDLSEDKSLCNENLRNLNQSIMCKKKFSDKTMLQMNKQKCHFMKNWKIFSPNFIEPIVTKSQLQSLSKKIDPKLIKETLNKDRKNILEDFMDYDFIDSTKKNKKNYESSMFLNSEKNSLFGNTQDIISVRKYRDNQNETNTSLNENTIVKTVGISKQRCRVALKKQFKLKLRSQLNGIFDSGLLTGKNNRRKQNVSYGSNKSLNRPNTINFQGHSRNIITNNCYLKNHVKTPKIEFFSSYKNPTKLEELTMKGAVQKSCGKHVNSTQQTKMKVVDENYNTKHFIKKPISRHFTTPLHCPKSTANKPPQINCVKIQNNYKPFKDEVISVTPSANKLPTDSFSTMQSEVLENYEEEPSSSVEFVGITDVQVDPQSPLNCSVENDKRHRTINHECFQKPKKNYVIQDNLTIISPSNNEMPSNTLFPNEKSKLHQGSSIYLESAAELYEQQPSKEDLLSTCQKIDDSFQTNNILNWNKETLPGGENVYINPVTGMSSYLTPNKEVENIYAPQNRLWFMPKGISPILQNKNVTVVDMKDLTESERDAVEKVVLENCSTDLNTVKWRSTIDSNKGLCEVIDLLSKNDSTTPWVSKACTKKSCVFSAKSLSTAQVLGQVDSKFIAVLMEPIGEVNKFLVLFDQHAVDERIRLEALISEYRNSEGELVSYALNPGVALSLTESERSLAVALLPKLSKVGLQLAVETTSVTATAVPLCVHNRVARERASDSQLMEKMLSVLIRQVLLSAEEARGVVPSTPQLVLDIINSEACRGAVKFGDSLSMAQSQMLVKKLAHCEVPFQCAHGRPVLAPLLELGPLPLSTNQKEFTNLRRLSKRIFNKKQLNM